MAFILNDAKRVVGRISNTGANNYTIHATLEERSTDIATNTSSLYYKVWLTADNDSYVTDIDGNTKYMSGWAFDNGNITAYININGSSFTSAQNSNFSMGYPGYGYSYPSSVTILEGTKSIAHNSDGTLTVAVTAGITNNNNYGATPASGSMSKTASLTTIARKSTMTATNATLGGSVTFSITSKSSSFTHKIYASCGSWTNNNQPISTGGAWTVPDLSGYFTSSETSKAVNFTLYTYNGSTTVGSSTASCTVSLPGKNTSSAQSVQLGSSKNIPITKAYSSYKSTVEYTLNGGSSWTRIGDVQTTGTSVSFSPAASLGSNFPTEMSHTYTFRVTTYANSTGGYRSIGSNTYNLTLTIPDYQPSVSFTTARIKNDNSTIAGWGVAVKGYTKYEYAATSTNYYGATTASWSFSCGGRTKSGSSGTTDAFTSTGSSTPTIVVTDSRGKQNNAKASAITIYDYGAPVIISSYAYRSDANGNKKDDGTKLCFLINAKTDYSCGGHNTISVSDRVRATNDTWGDWVSQTNNKQVISIANFSATTSFQIELRVVDSIGSSKSVTYTIPTAFVTEVAKAGGHGYGFFGYPQIGDNTVEVFGKVQATEGILLHNDGLAFKSASSSGIPSKLIYSQGQTGSNTGWFNVARKKLPDNNQIYPFTASLSLQRNYNNATPEAYEFSLSQSWTSGSITQLNGHYNWHQIDRVGILVDSTSHYVYISFHISTANNNSVCATINVSNIYNGGTEWETVFEHYPTANYAIYECYTAQDALSAPNIVVKNHSSAIGTTVFNSGGISVPNNAWGTGKSVTLTRGKWIVLSNASWTNNANGTRIINVERANYFSGEYSVSQNSGSYTNQSLGNVWDVSENESITLTGYAFQNSGVNLTCNLYIRAIRIE